MKLTVWQQPWFRPKRPWNSSQRQPATHRPEGNVPPICSDTRGLRLGYSRRARRGERFREGLRYRRLDRVVRCHQLWLPKVSCDNCVTNCSSDAFLAAKIFQRMCRGHTRIKTHSSLASAVFKVSSICCPTGQMMEV